MSSSSARALEESIRNRILDGKLATGDRIAPARQLAEQYGVSYFTVLRRIHKLCEEGYLECQHGSGIFVRSRATVRIGAVTGLHLSNAFMNLLHLYKESTLSPNVANVTIEEFPYNEHETVEAVADRVAKFDIVFLSDFVVTHGFPLSRLAPLDRLMDLTEEERQDYYPGMREFFSADGALRLLPLAVSPMVLFYNRSLLRKAGLLEMLREIRSFGDLVPVHQRVRAAAGGSIEGMTFGFDYKRFALLLRALSSQSPSVPPAFQDPAIRDCLRRLKALLRQMDINRPEPDAQAARERFLRGETWALIDLTSFWREIRRRADFAPDILPLPVAQTELWCSGVAVTPDGSMKRGVRDVLRFFKSRHALEIIGREGGLVPARRSAAEAACATAEADGEESFKFLPAAAASGFLPQASDLGLGRICQSALDAWDLL